jgi:predicted nucleic-acid-binding protein
LKEGEEGEEEEEEEQEAEEDKSDLTDMEIELLRHLEVYDSIHKNLKMLKKSLFSKNYPNECIESLRIINLLRILEAKDSFSLWKKSFGLIWVKEPMLKQELLKIFHKTYIDGSEPELVVIELVKLAQKLNFNERLSFEEIIRQLLIQEKVFKNGEDVTINQSNIYSQSMIEFDGNTSKKKKKTNFKDEFM